MKFLNIAIVLVFGGSLHSLAFADNSAASKKNEMLQLNQNIQSENLLRAQHAQELQQKLDQLEAYQKQLEALERRVQQLETVDLPHVGAAPGTQ